MKKLSLVLLITIVTKITSADVIDHYEAKVRSFAPSISISSAGLTGTIASNIISQPALHAIGSYTAAGAIGAGSVIISKGILLYRKHLVKRSYGRMISLFEDVMNGDNGQLEKLEKYLERKLKRDIPLDHLYTFVLRHFDEEDPSFGDVLVKFNRIKQNSKILSYGKFKRHVLKTIKETTLEELLYN